MIGSLVLALVLLPQESEKIVLDLGGGVKMEFVKIQAGKFMMGDKDFLNATPHEVTITKDYWMQTTETTQGQWKAVMGKNPSRFRGACPPRGAGMGSAGPGEGHRRTESDRAPHTWEVGAAHRDPK